jgi:hypothetical protein
MRSPERRPQVGRAQGERSAAASVLHGLAYRLRPDSAGQWAARSHQADRQPRDAISEAVVSLPSNAAGDKRMTIQRMEHVGIVVDDLVAPRAFFVGDLAGSGA